MRSTVNLGGRRYAGAFAALLAIFVAAIAFIAEVRADTLTVDPRGEIQTIAKAATLARR